MSYLTQDEIASNTAMRNRMAQAATLEGQIDSDYWVNQWRRTWGAAPGWDEAWEYAKLTHEPPGDGEAPYDPGRDETVITDGMILSQVQAMLAAAP